MNAGVKPVFTPMRRVDEYRAGEITVCENSADGGLYTVLHIRERLAKLLFVEADAKTRESGGAFRFFAVEPDGGALIVAAPHITRRRLIEFAVASCPSVAEKVGICLRLVRACMVSGMPWWLLYLCLTDDNVQLYASGAVKFDLFIDLDNINAARTERDCARRCGALVWKVLESLTEQEKRRSNAYSIIQMMERNDSYTTLLQLHKDLEAVLRHPARTPSFNRLLDWSGKQVGRIVRILRVTATVLALILVIALLKNIFLSEISFPDFRYRGLEQIGEIRLGE